MITMSGWALGAQKSVEMLTRYVVIPSIFSPMVSANVTLI